MLFKPLARGNLSRSTGTARKRTTIVASNKQFVPSDSFGGASPERAASKALRNLFTFISARIVLAQLEGSGRGSLAAYDKTSYDDLMNFLQNERMSDCDEWLTKLMRTNSALAMRLMEVRLAYATEDFEWDQLQRLSTQDLSQGNIRIMRHKLTASLNAPTGADSSTNGGEDGPISGVKGTTDS